MFIAYLTLQHRVTPKLYLLILLILIVRVMSMSRLLYCTKIFSFSLFFKFMRDTNFAIFFKRYENRPRLKD